MPLQSSANSLTRTRVSSSRKCRRMSRYRIEEVRDGNARGREREPAMAPPQLEGEDPVQQQVEATASRLTNMGVLRRSMA